MKQRSNTTAPRRLTPALLVALWAAACASADDAEGYVDGGRNEYFELWCGENEVCAWDVEAGEVTQAPTWHRKALGIGLLGDPAIISQVIGMTRIDCLTLTLLGSIDPDATLYFEVDFYNDGDPEGDVSIPIKELRWQPVHRETGVPGGCREARIRLRKTGPGRVVLDRAVIDGNSFCAANPTRDPGGGDAGVADDSGVAPWTATP